MNCNLPRMIGYWFDPSAERGRRFPHPQDFVRTEWLDPPSRAALLRYLRESQQFASYRGLSWCRFPCGADCCSMGHQEFWDGQWVWPEGLAHYVENHDVYLPDELAERAISIAPGASLLKPTNPLAVDLDYWLTWASKNSKWTPGRLWRMFRYS